MAEEIEEQATGKIKSNGAGSLKKILVMLVGGLALVGVSVAATLFVAGGKDAGDDEAAEESADIKGDTSDKTDKKKSKKAKKGKKGKDGKEAKEEKPAAVTYLPLDPPFVVNFQNPQHARFLQVSVEVMTKESAAVDDVKKHMPAIRSSLVLLFSSQTHETLASPDGKEKLREATLAEVQKILKEHTGKPAVEAVYFTGFVMQ